MRTYAASLTTLTLLAVCLGGFLHSEKGFAYGKARSLLAATPLGNPGFSLHAEIPASLTIQKDSIDHFLSEIENKLPASVKEGLSQKWTVRFIVEKNGKELPPLSLPRCQPHRPTYDGFWGEIESLSARTLLLHADLLRAIQEGKLYSEVYDCGHGNLYSEAMGVVIRNLITAFDQTAGSTPEKEKELFDAQKEVERLENKMSRSGEIDRARDHSETQNLVLPSQWAKAQTRLRKAQQSLHVISGLPLFQQISDIQRNLRPKRTLGHGDYEDLEQTLAVNLEYFLLDPTYFCRRPYHYQFFRQFLSHTPFETTPCKPGLNIPVDFSILSQKRVYSIDPDRVYEIDYVVAGEGEDIESRWGHAMFRIVGCAPNTPLGPDCLADTHYHLGAGFGAVVTATETNPLKGAGILPGVEGYPAQLEILPFKEAIHRYAPHGRNLKIYPLKFSESQKKLFLYRLTQIFWEYDGEYSFLTNNCADEALNLIKTATFGHPIQEHSVLTPTGLRDLLLEVKLSSDPFLSHETRAIQLGYFVQATDARDESTLSDFVEATGKPPLHSAEEFYRTSSALDRLEAFYEQLETEDRIDVEDLFSIAEKIIYTHQVDLLVADNLQWLTDLSRQDPQFSAWVKETQDLREFILQSSLTGNGYGIPIAEDLRKSKKTSDSQAQLFTKIQSIQEKLLIRSPEIARRRVDQLLSKEFQRVFQGRKKLNQKLLDQIEKKIIAPHLPYLDSNEVHSIRSRLTHLVKRSS